jgi:hypothetical protein
MAYSSTNPPALVTQRIGGGPALWLYTSTHTAAEAAASSFFSNGHALGMRAGDFLWGNQGSSTAHYQGFVTAVTSSAGATILTVATSS